MEASLKEISSGLTFREWNKLTPTERASFSFGALSRTEMLQFIKNIQEGVELGAALSDEDQIAVDAAWAKTIESAKARAKEALQ